MNVERDADRNANRNANRNAGRGGHGSEDTLHIDCGSCAARGLACDDCVVSVLLGQPETGVDLDASDQAALAALAESGLVPPLRLIPGARPARAVQSRLDWPEFG